MYINKVGLMPKYLVKVKVLRLYTVMAEEQLFCLRTGLPHDDLQLDQNFCGRCGGPNPLYKASTAAPVATTAPVIDLSESPVQRVSGQANTSQPTAPVARFANLDHQAAELARQTSIRATKQKKKDSSLSSSNKHSKTQVGQQRSSRNSFDVHFIVGFRPKADTKPLVSGRGWTFNLFRKTSLYTYMRQCTDRYYSSRSCSSSYL